MGEEEFDILFSVLFFNRFWIVQQLPLRLAELTIILSLSRVPRMKG